ncbi:hypothetical protein INR49_027000 [Caranx melampygus]|nr:hypothetical protein INR49_027000 [Caranx melampygus]
MNVRCDVPPHFLWSLKITCLSDLMLQPTASLPSMVALPSWAPPRQGVRPWTKDLSLYEEYKLRRNELRRRSLSRRRELEKSLPQPLLADLVRVRREKTRLRVARWRAKRKLQACLNQAQAQGGSAALSPTGFPISNQEQLRAAAASASGGRQRQSSTLPQSSSFLNNNSNSSSSSSSSSMSVANSISATLPFITSSSSSSSSLLLRGHSMATHQHAVTSASSSSSSSSYSQVSVSLSQQSISLTDADMLQWKKHLKGLTNQEKDVSGRLQKEREGEGVSLCDAFSGSGSFRAFPTGFFSASSQVTR